MDQSQPQAYTRERKGEAHLDKLQPDLERLLDAFVLAFFVLIVLPLSIVLVVIRLPPLIPPPTSTTRVVRNDASTDPRRPLPLLCEVPGQHPLPLHESLPASDFHGNRRNG